MAGTFNFLLPFSLFLLLFSSFFRHYSICSSHQNNLFLLFLSFFPFSFFFPAPLLPAAVMAVVCFSFTTSSVLIIGFRIKVSETKAPVISRVGTMNRASSTVAQHFHFAYEGKHKLSNSTHFKRFR